MAKANLPSTVKALIADLPAEGTPVAPGFIDRWLSGMSQILKYAYQEQPTESAANPGDAPTTNKKP